MRPADRLTVAPPQPDPVPELGVVLEQGGPPVRVVPVPGLHPDVGDAFGGANGGTRWERAR